MAQQLRNITIQAPAFAGINTEDSPVGIDQSFAEQANNCVIDKFGRVGSRKGTVKLTTALNPSNALGSSRGIEAAFEFLDTSGDKRILSAGNNKIFSGTSTLTDITPAGYTPTGNNWKIIDFNNHAYFFQRGHEPLIYTDESGSAVLEAHSDHSHATGTPPQANEALAAYGRVWAADVTGNKHTVYWTDTLQGHHWTGGTSGSLDLTTVFPNGFDEIVALTAHNDFLVIFCKDCIIIYSGASSPANMTLADTIDGVGCVARDSVQNIGSDIIFLSKDGVRSLGRVVQEKSLPMRDISKNVRSDIISFTATQTNPIKSLYSPENAFYLLSFPNNKTVFCFDIRQALPDGSYRVTTWTDIDPLAFTRLQDGSVYFGKSDGIYEYKEHKDNGEAFRMTYFSNPLNFGDSSRLKFLKKFNITFIGNKTSNSTLKWGYDYTNTYNEKRIEGASLLSATSAEYGVAEYGTKETTTLQNGTVGDSSFVESEYTSGIDIQRPKINTTGSGGVVQIGIESFINGQPFSIQQIDVQALLGRII